MKTVSQWSHDISKFSAINRLYCSFSDLVPSVCHRRCLLSPTFDVKGFLHMSQTNNLFSKVSVCTFICDLSAWIAWYTLSHWVHLIMKTIQHIKVVKNVSKLLQLTCICLVLNVCTDVERPHSDMSVLHCSILCNLSHYYDSLHSDGVHHPRYRKVADMNRMLNRIDAYFQWTIF